MTAGPGQNRFPFVQQPSGSGCHALARSVEVFDAGVSVTIEGGMEGGVVCVFASILFPVIKQGGHLTRDVGQGYER